MKLEIVKKLKAQELNQVFDFYGNYYQYDNYQFRDQLEIIVKDKAPSDLKAFKDMTPDLLTVMINPGSSRPIDKSYIPPNIELFEEVGGLNNHIQIVPDVAQYAIAKIMVLMGFEHTKVINLSDLREPKSNLFYKALDVLPEGHSIFSDSRRTELDSIADSRPTVLIATGKSMKPKARELANLATQYFEQKALRIIGVKDEKDGTYLYPSPPLQSMKDRYLEKLSASHIE